MDENLRTFASIVRYPGPPEDLLPYLEASGYELEPAILSYISTDPVSFYESLRSQSQNASLLRWTRESTRTRARSEASNNENSQVETTSSSSTSPILRRFFLPLRALLIPFFFSLHLASYLFTIKTPRKRNIDPVDTAALFKQRFAEDVLQISQRSDVEQTTVLRSPDFLQKGYTQALYMAKSEARWLLVYVQDDDHDDKMKFIERILISERFHKFISDNQIILWGGNCAQSEAFQAANALGCTKFPFMALLCLTTRDTPTTEGMTRGAPALEVVSRVQGYHPLRKILGKFTQQMERYEPGLVAIRAEIHERNAARELRAQQDARYAELLARDARRKQEREQKKRLYAEFKKNLFAFAASLVNKCVRHVKGTLGRIAVRMPLGSRIMGYFEGEESTKEVYYYVDFIRKGFIEDGKINKEKMKEYYKEFYDDDKFGTEIDTKELGHHEFEKMEFSLYSTFPRKELEFGEDQQIKNVDFLWPNGSLVCELNTQETVEES